MKVIKLVVFGGRDFAYDTTTKEYKTDVIIAAFKAINKCMVELIKDPNVKIVVVDGIATGADEVGYRWGQSCNYEPERYAAKWRDENGTYNPRAGFERNSELLKAGTHFIGFWDGVSRGTNDTRKKVIKAGLPLRMFEYDETQITINRQSEWEC